MNIYKLQFPLDSVFSNSSLVLTKVTPDYEYADGKKTENVVGTKYEVVEMTDFERFTVKVADKSPVITQEELDDLKESGTRIFVTFDNAVMKLYRKPDGTTDGTVRAEGIHILKK